MLLPGPDERHLPTPWRCCCGSCLPPYEDVVGQESPASRVSLRETAVRKKQPAGLSLMLTLKRYCTLAGVFLLAIGLTDSHNLGTMVGLICIGFAFFDEGANGLNFALVPHVHPYANGIVSGVAGAAGNFGGIIFAIVFRYGGGYAHAMWIIGAMIIAQNVLTFWIRPLPQGQIGGR